VINNIKTVVVCGAGGQMGSTIGGLISQSGLKVYFLSRSIRNANIGKDRAIANCRSEIISKNIICGSYDMMEEALKEADLVIEAVSEDVSIKQDIYKEIEKYRRHDTIIASTTSSLLLSKLIVGLPKDFVDHFIITHFYNPPSKMLVCEVVRCGSNSDVVFNTVIQFLKERLNRKVVVVNDITGFAGNRVAFAIFNLALISSVNYGVEVIDYITGSHTGRKMPLLKTLDLIGLDIYKSIVENLNKEGIDLHLPAYVDEMIDNGIIGIKSLGGFYKKSEEGILLYDIETCKYSYPENYKSRNIEDMKEFIKVGRYKEAFNFAMKKYYDGDRDIKIMIDFLCFYVWYSYTCVGEVTSHDIGISGINDVMSYGFNWAPPEVVSYVLGGKEEMTKLFEERGLEIPHSFKDLNIEKYNNCDIGKYFLV
jgi:3-hydroxyacyl-CoA dehydrogenase